MFRWLSEQPSRWSSMARAWSEVSLATPWLTPEWSWLSLAPEWTASAWRGLYWSCSHSRRHPVLRRPVSRRRPPVSRRRRRATAHLPSRQPLPVRQSPLLVRRLVTRPSVQSRCALGYLCGEQASRDSRCRFWKLHPPVTLVCPLYGFASKNWPSSVAGACKVAQLVRA